MCLHSLDSFIYLHENNKQYENFTTAATSVKDVFFPWFTWMFQREIDTVVHL